MKSKKEQKDIFFSLCFVAQKDILSKKLSRDLLLIYLASYVVHILTLKGINLFKFNFYINSIVFVIIFCIFLLVLSQSVLFLIFGKQFYLSAQLKIFRYTLIDHGMNFILKELTNTSNFTSDLSIFLFIIYAVLGIVTVFCVSFGNSQQKTLMNFNLSYSLYFFIFNFLLQLIDLITFHALKSSLLVFLLFCIYNALENEGNICTEKWEKIFIGVVVNFTLVVTIYLLVQHLLSEAIDTYLLNFVIACVYTIVGVFLVNRAKQNQIMEFENAQQTSDFLKIAQTFIFDIDSVLGGSKKFEETGLKAYLSSHPNVCKIPSCPLFGEEAKTQLKYLHETKNIKNIVRKLRKHIELHFQERFLLDPDDTCLSFAYLRFLIIFTSFKRKAIQLYNTLSKQKYNLSYSYQLFKLKSKLDDLQNQEQIATKKTTSSSNILFLSYNQLYTSIIDKFRKMSNLLAQEKIDFNLLVAIAHQMTSQRNQLDKFIQKVLQVETFSSFKILNLYSQCCKQLFQEYGKAERIEKHLSNLIEKLDNKKQIQFLSNRSEVGLVAISLSENSLGNIFSMNNHAQSVFGFEEKDILGRSVNNIMPSTFAAYHDSLLMVFLKNRYKKVNGDERVLIGKHKNGFIFPVMLRLQRVIVSSDELVFVANIRRYKTRESPIMFIVTAKGDIVDFSAGFQYYFMKKSKKMVKTFHIQEISPNFEEITRHKATVFSISNEYRQQMVITVDFDVTPLTFFGNLQAYYLFGKKVRQTTKNSSGALIPITNLLSQLILKSQLSCHYNYYTSSYNKNQFQISKDLNTIDPKLIINRDLTIPFLNMNCFSNIIDYVEEQPKDYAKGIKTIRFFKNHFQLAQLEEDTNQSDIQSEEKEFFISKRKTIKIDDIQQSCDELAILLKFIFLMTISMCIINFSSFFFVENIISSKQNSLMSEIAQYQVKQYISDFLLFQNFKNVSFNQQFYSQQAYKIQNRVIEMLESPFITQGSKQSYFKIIYSQTSLSEIGNLFSRIFSNLEDKHPNYYVLYGNLSFIIVLIFLLMAYLWSFKERIFTIYTYFLYLEESTIIQLASSCDKMQKITSQKEGLINQQDDKQNNQEIEQNEGVFIKKFKSFNNSSKRYQVTYIIQIFAFIALIGAINSVLMALNYKIEDEIHIISSLTTKLSRIQSQSSVYILSSFLSNLRQNITVESNYGNYLQDLQIQVISFIKYEQNSTLMDIVNTFISGNICNSPHFHSINNQTCQNLANGISINGVFSVMDYIYSQILRINAKANKQMLNQFCVLTRLQYEIIEKSINSLNKILIQIKMSYQELFLLIYYLLCSLMIIILIVQLLFLINFPFKSMEKEIQSAYKMIELFQSFSKGQSFKNDTKKKAIEMMFT